MGKNIIEIDNRYRAAFSSIVTLAKCGFDLSKVIKYANENEIAEMNNENIYRLVDSDFSSDEQEFSIENDGATWFKGIRGEKINEGMASWLTLIANVSEEYHKQCSFIEYDSNELSKEEVTKIEKIQKRDIKVLIDTFFPYLDEYTIRPLPLGEDSDHIYGLILKLSVSSGGTGESKPVLGKLYFQKSTSNLKVRLNPLNFDVAYDIDKFFTESVGEKIDGGFELVGEAEESIINNVGSALDDLFSKNNGDFNLNDGLIFCEEDKKLIDALYEKNPFVGIVMTEIKLLTVTHVKWNNVAYDIIHNGEPVLRVKFGINNNLTLTCIKCGYEDIITAGKIRYNVENVEVVKQIQISDGKIQLSNEEIEEIKNSNTINEHMYLNGCVVATRGFTCNNLCCKSSAIDFENGNRYCINCPYPEVIFETSDRKLVRISDMKFAYDMGVPTLVSRDTPVETCSFCGRTFTNGSTYCGLCSQICEASSTPDLEEAELLYKNYRNMLPLGTRVFNLFNKKYCYEDNQLIVFKVGKKGYLFEKADVYIEKQYKVKKVGWRG